MPFANSPQVERRITLRLLAYWEKLRRGQPMPAESDVTPEAIQDLWADCFILHIDDQGGICVYYMGVQLTSTLEQSVGTDDPVMLEGDLKNHWLEEMQKTLRPRLYEGEVVGKNGRAVRFRQCLLPLGEEGKLTAVLGGMRCKVT